MRLFVSYSRRDGIVTTELLRSLEIYLRGFCKPFIHCLAEQGSKWEQIHVISSLVTSHAILIVKSPATSSSEWVQLEIGIATFLRIPVLELDSHDLVILHEAEHSHSPELPSNTRSLPSPLLAAR
jgi:hypothetical protein